MSEPRLGYDHDEGIWFDRTKPSGEVDETKGALYEECDPIEVCAELEILLRSKTPAAITEAELRRLTDERGTWMSLHEHERILEVEIRKAVTKALRNTVESDPVVDQETKYCRWTGDKL